MNPGQRTLHFAHGAEDAAAARQLIEHGPIEGAHWVVSSDGEAPDSLPLHAEWIRLPDNGHPTGREWFDSVNRLVSALGPESIVFHPAFDRHHPARGRDLRRTHARLRLMPSPSSSHRRVGYVLKKFPRYSETFILREVLALEALGTPVQVFSLNPPLDGRFHHLLGRLNHSVEYLPPVPRGKAIQASLPVLPADMRERFERLQWEIVDRARPELFTYLAHAVQIAIAVREHGIEHLHAHFATSASETARMAADLAEVTYSFTSHAKDMYADTVDTDAYAQLLSDSEFAVTVCRANEEFLHQQYPAQTQRVRVLYNGIDFDEVEEAALGAPTAPVNGPPLVLAVGRFVEKKGFDLFLGALAVLRQRDVAFRARILGSGELFDEILAERDRLGLNDVVDMPGAASMEQVRQAMNEATLVVCPSKVAANGDKDALPTVLLEAMSLGVPCVGTDVGGIREILAEGKVGLLVQPAVDDLTDAIEHLLTSPDMAKILGDAGREHAAAAFDIATNVGVLQSWFDTPTTASAGAHMVVLSQDGGIAWDSPKGAAVHIRSIARSAREAGFHTSVFVRDQLATSWSQDDPDFGPVDPHRDITRYFKRSTDENGARFRELGAIARNSAAIDALVRVHEDRPIQLIYERYSLWSDAGANAAALLGVPFVLEVNAPLIAEQLRFRSLHFIEEARDIERRVLSAADRVVVVSQALKAHVMRLGVEPARIVVLPNVADPERFACASYSPPDSDHPFRIGFSGALKPWHGISQFIEVFRQVHAQRPHVRLEILGDSRHREKLEEDVRIMGLSDVITFLGHVPHDDVPAHLARWDLAVAPYPEMDDFYFSPLKLAEAMAAGRPIMASAIGDIPAMLGNGRHGILVPAGAWPEWVSALIEAVDNPESLMPLAESARNEAATWSWDDHLREAVGTLLQSEPVEPSC